MSKTNLKHILKTFVEVPSVTGDFDASRDVIERAAEYFALARVKHIKTGSINNYPYLLASTQVVNDKTLWFVSHMDVVPAHEDHFKLTEDGNSYYGRGVFDMKGMVAATIAPLFKVEDVQKLNVAYLLTTDEEIGGKNGVGSLINASTRANVAFVFDQGSHWVLQERMKGVLWIKVVASGKAAHGARPWLGSNANDALVQFLTDYSEWFALHIPQNHPEKYFTTSNLGILEGGLAANQVPSRAEAVLDIRFISDHDAKQIINGLTKLTTKAPEVSFEVIMHEPCVDNDMSEKWFRYVAKFIKQTTTPDLSLGERLGHGTTDGRFFAPHNVPVISTRPPGGNQHADGEWVSKVGLAQLEELVARLLSESTR